MQAQETITLFVQPSHRIFGSLYFPFPKFSHDGIHICTAETYNDLNTYMNNR